MSAARAASTLAALAGLLFSTPGCFHTTLPGRSFTGEPPPLTSTQADLRDRLRGHVELLATEIGERHLWRLDALDRAADYVAAQFRDAGYDVSFHEYEERGRTVRNVIAERRGSTRPDEILVIGAHYDTRRGTPGADDNATGVATTIEVARMLGGAGPSRPGADGDRPALPASKPAFARTVRFVAFVNEEEPFFWTGRMGSRMYAKRCRALGEDVVGMIAFDMLGYFQRGAGTQSYPPPFNFYYPSEGNFVTLLSNHYSRGLMNAAARAFRRNTAVPSEGLASAEFVVGHSDHWSFWMSGYKAIMFTDTAMFRNPHYHKATDTPDTLDYDSLARVTAGIADVVRELAESDERY